MLRMTPLALALTMAWGLTPGLSAAQTPTEPAPADATRLNEVTVSATRTPRRTDNVPNTVTVKTAQEIEEEGARDIKDVFRNEIDVTVRAQTARFSAAGSATGRAGNESINIRGLEGNQVLMVIDGVRVPNSYAFGPALSFGRGDFLVVDGIKTVEVLRGPASTQFGSDGLAGAVSVRTLDPSDLLKPGQTTGGFTRLGYTSVDDAWAGTLGLAHRHGPWQTMLLTTYKTGHETANQGGNKSLDANRTAPNPINQRNNYVLAKALYDVDARHQLGVTAESQQQQLDADLYTARSSTTLGLTGKDTLARERVSLEHRFQDINAPWVQKAQTRVYAQQSRATQFTYEDRTPAVDRTRDNSYNTRTLGLSTQLESDISGRLNQRLSYGLDWSRSESEGVRNGTVPPSGETFPSKAFPDTTYTTLGTFVQSEIEAGAVSVIPGLRFDQYQITPSQNGYSGTTVSLSDQAFTPRVGVVWRLDPAFAPYANWAKGFRAPQPDQVNNGFTNTTSGYRSIGNPNLKAERADSIELGFRGKAGTVRYSAAMFDNRYDDFISQQLVSGVLGNTSNPGTYQYVNLTNARIRGFEARMAWDISSQWNATAGVAQLTGDSEVNGVRTPIETIEPLKAVFGLRYQQATWAVRANLVYSQAKDGSRTAAGNYSSPEATVLDLGANWKLNKSLTLNANLNNVFDRKYWRWSDVRGLLDNSTVKDAYTAPGRNIQVSVRYDF